MLEEYDVRLLDSAFSIERKDVNGEEQEEMIVRLYGKTRDGRSITILCPDFRPYFYVLRPGAGLRALLEAADDVLSVQDCVKEYKGTDEPFVRVVVRGPWAVQKLRKEFDLDHKTLYLESPPKAILQRLAAAQGIVEIVETEHQDGVGVRVSTDDRVFAQNAVNDFGLLEYMEPFERRKYENRGVFFSADIQFTNQFIYDYNLGTCVRVRAAPADPARFTTNLTVRAVEFDECPVFTPPMRILSFDIETSIKHGNIYCICATMLDEATGQKESCSFVSAYGPCAEAMTADEKRGRANDERKMIDAFVAEVRKLDPDVITGYNINNFDLQMIYDRCEKLGMYKKIGVPLGRDAVGMGRRENRTTGFVTWDVKGRLMIDTWLSVKKELRPKREGLGYVSAQLFGDTKDNINATKMDKEWVDRRDEVVKYCLKDSDLALRILTNPKINTINKLMDVAIPSKLPVKEVAGGQNRMIESLLIRMVDRANIAVPTSSGEQYEYEGGFVYDTKAGLWEWVIGLDFSSMYPSQIIKHNICFTTTTFDPAEAAHTSPVGSMFISKEKRNGIVPQMVEGLLNSRKDAKKKKKEAEKNGDQDMAEYYDRLQGAIKILANATYGYFGARFCRWPYNRHIAPSVTAWARDEIRSVVKTLEDRGYTVVAGDTDSVFFISKDAQDQDACVKLGTEVHDHFSKEGMNLELEKVMERFFAHAKKRYFGKIAWPKPSLLVRGYEPRRTDSFDLQSETMTRVFEIVLDGKPDEAVQFSKNTIDRTLDGKVDLAKLVISKSVNEFSSYANADSLVHVSVAKKLIDKGYEFTPGMKTPFIITRGKTPLEAEPIIEGVTFTARPDYKYYAARLAAALARITEAFGCDERTLMQGNKQTTLFGFDSEEETEEEEIL